MDKNYLNHNFIQEEEKVDTIINRYFICSKCKLIVFIRIIDEEDPLLRISHRNKFLKSGRDELTYTCDEVIIKTLLE